MGMSIVKSGQGGGGRRSKTLMFKRSVSNSILLTFFKEKGKADHLKV